MALHVIIFISLSDKTHLTNFTLKPFITSMDPYVSIQVPFFSENLGAIGTRKVFLGGLIQINMDSY